MFEDKRRHKQLDKKSKKDIYKHVPVHVMCLFTGMRMYDCTSTAKRIRLL